MPVPYNFSNNPLNAKRNQSWFTRYRVVVVFGAVALVTLIIVLCITNCSGDSDAKTGAEKQNTAAAVEEENTRSEESSGNSGDVDKNKQPQTAPQQQQQNSAEWYKNEVKYVVKSGDMLRHIVRRHHASERGVIKLNALSNPNAIRIGQKLRIIPGPWRLAIDSNQNTMTIFQNGKIYMRCPALCKALPGEYTMVWRQQHTDSAKRKKGSFYLILRNKQRKQAALEVRNDDIQQLLYLLPGGIPVTVTGNK